MIDSEQSRAGVERLEKFFAAFRDQASTNATRLTSFFQQFEEDYRRTRRDRAATTPHLDMLRVFGLEFAELRHSDVLAWFLKPSTEHEQGPLFMNALLQHFGTKPVANERYTVTRERHEHTDVAAYASNHFAVFIENKVRHHEREKQVSDMIDSMARVSTECEVPRERRFAIFLTDSGAKPITAPRADTAEFFVDNLKSMSRVQLFELFRAALEVEQHSPLLMSFLDSYLHSIRRIRAQLS